MSKIKFIFIFIFLLFFTGVADSEERIPENLEQAVNQLIAQNSSVELKEWASKELREAKVLAHRGMALGLRNEWGLWADSKLAIYFKSIGIDHPDDMSGIISSALWHRLNKKQYDLGADIKYYQDYWNKALKKHNKFKNENAASGSDASSTRPF